MGSCTIVSVCSQVSCIHAFPTLMNFCFVLPLSPLTHPHTHRFSCGTRQARSGSARAWCSSTIAMCMPSFWSSTCPILPASVTCPCGWRSAGGMRWGSRCPASWWATSVTWCRAPASGEESPANRCGDLRRLKACPST